MRLVAWTDKNGYRRQSFLPETLPDDMASKGIPHEPPPINKLDWDAIKRDLHNSLVNRGLINYEDVIKAQNGITGAIKSALRARLIALYKERR